MNYLARKRCTYPGQSTIFDNRILAGQVHLATSIPRSRPACRQPCERRRLAPGRGDPPRRRTVHGRREIRTLKVVTIAAEIDFPHATQALQITRRTRPVRAGRAGKWHTETVYCRCGV